MVLPRLAVETCLTGRTWGEVWRHQVRWARTIRVSQGAGYAGLCLANASLWALVAILVVNSVIGLFYNLRLMTAMFRAADGVPVAETVPRPVVASVALAVLAAALLCLGLYPAPALRLIQAIAGE